MMMQIICLFIMLCFNENVIMGELMGIITRFGGVGGRYVVIF